MNKIEEMRRNMTAAGVYREADIEKICNLEAQYLKECEEIAEECEVEGYPSYGGNYDLRCAESRKYYDELIEEIDSSYDELDEAIII
jgi:hypothetical protein